VSSQFEILSAGGSSDATGLVSQLGLDELDGELGRPRVIAAMIAAADGRAAVEGRAGGLGSPADRAVLRELRCSVDAILIGPTTLVDERYSTLLDSGHRARRIAAGLSAEPIAATISRRLDPQIAELELFAQPEQRIVVYSESSDPLEASGADLTVVRSQPGELTLAGCLKDLYANHGARTLLSEGGPTLLRALAAEGLIDDFIFTVSPLLVAGSAPTLLSGEAFEQPLGLALENVWRSDSFLFLHYTRQR
jgi:riboflavin biosynthesis pyrimidine reductase